MHITKLTQKLESLAAKFKPFYWIASLYYYGVIKREIRLANIKRDDRVLCVGGGNCPFSAILLHQMTGAKVTVIDKCANCVCEARQVVNNLGLREHVCVERADGCFCELALDEYSVIHFAMQVCPMEQVFSCIKNRAAPGTKLIVRKPKNALGKMYCPLRGTNVKPCRCVTHAAACNIGSSQLFVKRQTSSAAA